MGKLTAVKIEKVKSKPGWYGDGDGLWLRVKSPTAITWSFRYMLNGTAREMGLGKYGLADDEIALAEARELAVKHRAVLKKERKDPLAVDKAVRATKAADAAKAKPFKDCALAYIEAHRAGWKNEKHIQQWENTLEEYTYPIIGPLPIQAIDTDLVLEVLQQKNKTFGKDKTLWAARPETANRLRGRIEAILNWAKANKLREGENPAAWRGHLENLLPHRSKIQKVEHHPALPYAEIGAFMKALRGNSDTAARALEFTILCVTRTSETRGAKWGEINLKEKIWVVPAERMKMRREHRIPLSARAVEILKALKPDDATADDFVFKGRKKGNQLSDGAMLMLLERIGHGDVTTHGFRSTFRDWAGEVTAHPREVCEHALAHGLKDKSEAAYQRGDLFAKRRVLMDDWSNFCAAPPAKKRASK